MVVAVVVDAVDAVGVDGTTESAGGKGQAVGVVALKPQDVKGGLRLRLPLAVEVEVDATAEMHEMREHVSYVVLKRQGIE